MWAHYWTDAPAPAEVLLLTLCEMFHAPPSVVLAERTADVLPLLTVAEVRARVEEMKRRERGG